MNFKKEISKLISKETGKDEKEILSLLEVPPNVELGDYALPVFTFAKDLKKAPNNIAKDLSGKIKADFLESVESTGPYLNFKIKNEYFAKTIIENKPEFKETNKKIMVEFSQPNTHKEFHVGHLRNASLGDSIVRILKFTGNNVIPVNYPGDIGTHVAKTLWCLNNFHKGEVIKGSKGKYLGKIYLEANQKVKENDKFKDEVSKVLQDLEARKPDITRQWLDTREWSLDELRYIYKDLNIKFDKYFFESEEDRTGKEIALELLEKGIAKESEGAIIVDLEEEKLGVALVLKSDGTTLYLTKDLSLAQKKFNDYKIDTSVYVVDSRQSLHFKQVFKILELMGFKQDMIHVPYEFVSTKNGPISSRTGNTFLYEDLKESMVKKLNEETRKRHSEWSDKKVEETSNQIANAALKFGMIKIENNKEIIFDEDEWLDFEGETGPYVQYAHARICSIQRKANFSKTEIIDYSLLDTSEDSVLLHILANEEKVIKEAAKNYKPSILARYVLDLAQKMNEYYHKHQILKSKEELRDARLSLFEKIRETIKRDLDLLGIQAPEEM